MYACSFSSKVTSSLLLLHVSLQCYIYWMRFVFLFAEEDNQHSTVWAQEWMICCTSDSQGLLPGKIIPGTQNQFAAHPNATKPQKNRNCADHSRDGVTGAIFRLNNYNFFGKCGSPSGYIVYRGFYVFGSRVQTASQGDQSSLHSGLAPPGHCHWRIR